MKDVVFDEQFMGLIKLPFEQATNRMNKIIPLDLYLKKLNPLENLATTNVTNHNLNLNEDVLIDLVKLPKE
jgi:hypothetical protein